MSSLIERIRRARETVVEASGFKFTVRRPTNLEAREFTADLKQGDVLRRFVVGWEGVKEVDIAPGGTGDAVPFDADLFVEWVADRPDLWNPLTAAVVESFANHRKQQAETLKNSGPG